MPFIYYSRFFSISFLPNQNKIYFISPARRRIGWNCKTNAPHRQITLHRRIIHQMTTLLKLVLPFLQFNLTRLGYLAAGLMFDCHHNLRSAVDMITKLNFRLKFKAAKSNNNIFSLKLGLFKWEEEFISYQPPLHFRTYQKL